MITNMDMIRNRLLTSYRNVLDNPDSAFEKSYLLGMVHTLDYFEVDDHIESVMNTIRTERYHVY